jgi:multidrug efflux pump subunit AcrA (membrane-fusion protein)
MTATAQHRSAPRLDLRAPLLMGGAAVLLFFGAGIGGAAYAPIEKGVGLAGKIIVESKTKPVQHPRGGTIAEVKVVEGQHVALGEVLMTLDTQALDEQIGALKAQSEAAARQLDLVRTEAATMADLLERKLAPKSRLLQLERQVEDVTKEAAGLSGRIAVAQGELDKSVLRAPVAGRVLSLDVAGPGAVIQPGAAVLEIVPDGDRLVVEGRLTPGQIEDIKPGMTAKVWLTALSWRDQRPLSAKLAWVSADSVDDKRTGQPYFVARVELDEARADIAKSIVLQPGMRAEILLVTGHRTLLTQLLDPLMRSVNRAFRG